jgi:hypothetical protein
MPMRLAATEAFPIGQIQRAANLIRKLPECVLVAEDHFEATPRQRALKISASQQSERAFVVIAIHRI